MYQNELRTTYFQQPNTKILGIWICFEKDNFDLRIILSKCTIIVRLFPQIPQPHIKTNKYTKCHESTAFSISL